MWSFVVLAAVKPYDFLGHYVATLADHLEERHYASSKRWELTTH